MLKLKRCLVLGPVAALNGIRDLLLMNIAQAKSVKAIQALRAMPYDVYLKTPYWLDLRRRMIHKAGNQCQVCKKSGVGAVLNVHHRSYDRLGEELPSDLMVLCRECHSTHHGKLIQEPPDVWESIPKNASESERLNISARIKTLEKEATKLNAQLAANQAELDYWVDLRARRMRNMGTNGQFI